MQVKEWRHLCLWTLTIAIGLGTFIFYPHSASTNVALNPAEAPPPEIVRTEATFSTSGTARDPVFYSPPAPLGNLFITHSTTQNITALNSVSCNNGGLHTLNSYYRVFDLVGEFGITDPIQVDELSFGVEQALGNGGTQLVIVRLYTLSGPFILANLTQLGSENLDVPDGATGTIFTATFDPEITVPANSILVAEVFTPDGTASGNSFFIGSNADPETAPSYIRAPACGINQPTTTAAIGFPNMHIVLNVSAEQLVATPTSTPEPPTATPEPPTSTPEPPTTTPEPPTATPEPSTATPEPPTSTPISPSTTPEPPTATVTTTSLPATNTPVSGATSTPVPPTTTPSATIPATATPTISVTAVPQPYALYLPLTRRR